MKNYRKTFVCKMVMHLRDESKCHRNHQLSWYKTQNMLIKVKCVIFAPLPSPLNYKNNNCCQTGFLNTLRLSLLTLWAVRSHIWDVYFCAPGRTVPHMGFRTFSDSNCAFALWLWDRRAQLLSYTKAMQLLSYTKAMQCFQPHNASFKVSDI